MDVETIMDVATQIVNSGIRIVFLQAGQDPHCDALLDEVIPRIVNELGAQVLLCVGEREEETYRHFHELGAKSFILKYETSNPERHEQITHANLSKRMQCMQWIKNAGMKLGTGNITGIPQQSIDDIISDIRLAFSIQPDFVSTAPFIPNAGTPFQDCNFGDINLTLNTMAILRVGLKDALIPTVSALESLQTDGQLMGLNAGANVMTINFTPEKFRKNYKIYSKNRYIVKLEHALKTAQRAGLQIEL
jgi:biotin synthase